MFVTPQPDVFAIPQQASGIILLCIIVWFPGVAFQRGHWESKRLDVSLLYPLQNRVLCF